jgi:tRNA uridine 5-carboxymethylaminomethyl modification enzyme
MKRLDTLSVVGGPAVNERLAACGAAPLVERRATLTELLRRPELGYAEVATIAAAGGLALPPVAAAVAERAETEIKYQGYLRRQEAEARRLAKYEDLRLPDDLDYDAIPGLSNEAAEKLRAVRPRSLGQASRISGVTPVAVSLVATHLELGRRRAAAGAGTSS